VEDAGPEAELAALEPLAALDALALRAGTLCSS
jgi:hypothetical protein